jgi:hypothetical protein
MSASMYIYGGRSFDMMGSKIKFERFWLPSSRVGQDDRDRSIFNGLIRTIQFAGGARPT